LQHYQNEGRDTLYRKRGEWFRWVHFIKHR
jgi:hypothetical protein